MKLFRYFWSVVQQWFHRKPLPKKTIKVQEMPDRLHPNYIYVAGEGEYLWYVAMLCPCGCQEVLYMSLMPEGSPKWKLIEHNDGTVSLHPSVWRKKGCKSHFFLRQGLIQWCNSS